MQLHCWYYANFIDVKKFPSRFLLPFLMERLVGTKYLFFSGGQICIQKKNLLVIWLIKWKRKNWLHADEFWWNKWHVSSIIIRSKLNLLTEPENKNKQAAWIILLLSVNSTFLVREIFLKTSRILYLKITRVGMKVSNYHSVLFMLLCKFRPILPRSQKVFSTGFIGYFCASLL